jgi:hypothetical protein
VIGEGERYRGRTTVEAASLMRFGQGETERDVRSEPVVLEEGQAEEGIPATSSLGERVGLAGEAAQAVAQGAVEPLEVDGVGELR